METLSSKCAKAKKVIYYDCVWNNSESPQMISRYSLSEVLRDGWWKPCIQISRNGYEREKMDWKAISWAAFNRSALVTPSDTPSANPPSSSSSIMLVQLSLQYTTVSTNESYTELCSPSQEHTSGLLRAHLWTFKLPLFSKLHDTCN